MIPHDYFSKTIYLLETILLSNFTYNLHLLRPYFNLRNVIILIYLKSKMIYDEISIILNTII